MANVRLDWQATEQIAAYVLGYYSGKQTFSGFRNGALNTRTREGSTTFDVGINFTINENFALRAAVLNVTVTGTAGPGFLALFADGITYPGNSSVNFSAAGQTVANSAIVTMAAGKVKIHNGPAATHVIVDVVGTLL